MKRVIVVALSILAISAAAFAQSSAEIDKALLAAPRQLKEGATVIKWKPDFTYETLKKGTNRLVCYDRTGQPGQQPFAVECTSIANLERVAQSLKIEAIPTRRSSRRHSKPRRRPEPGRSPSSDRCGSTSAARTRRELVCT